MAQYTVTYVNADIPASTATGVRLEEDQDFVRVLDTYGRYVLVVPTIRLANVQVEYGV